MNQIPTSRTAILIFAQSAEAEAKHKAIAKADVLFDVLTTRTLETVEKTGLPYFHFSEKQQIGATFGERFTRAIQAVYDKGYERVITIGNDSPQLKPRHIIQAERQLEKNKFVLGPATDGGFYLMGIHRSQFDPLNFKELAWQTSALSKQLVRLISGCATAVFRLPVLLDIDTVQDIKSLVAYTFQLPKKLWVVLLRLFPSTEQIQSHCVLFVPILCTKAFYNKGSPVSISF